jgi:hypothetical protein
MATNSLVTSRALNFTVENGFRVYRRTSLLMYVEREIRSSTHQSDRCRIDSLAVHLFEKLLLRSLNLLQNFGVLQV